MKEIFEIDSLPKLEKFLSELPPAQTRKKLIKLFLQNAIYKNVDQWNKAVRVCEALAIVGWGEHEAVEAVRVRLKTMFVNPAWDRRYLNAEWTKRKTGLAINAKYSGIDKCPGLKKPTIASLKLGDDVQEGKLLEQRNWIPKNPIGLGSVISNCYPKSKALLKEGDRLVKLLEKKMRPESYGSAVNQISVTINLSYPVPGCGEENYIILEEEGKFSDEKLAKMLRKMYSAKEIEKNGYWLRPRYVYGGFRKAKGEMNVDIYYPKEFSNQSLLKQKREFADRLQEVIAGASSRLIEKKVDYDFDAMTKDMA